VSRFAWLGSDDTGKKEKGGEEEKKKKRWGMGRLPSPDFDMTVGREKGRRKGEEKGGKCRVKI